MCVYSSDTLRRQTIHSAVLSLPPEDEMFLSPPLAAYTFTIRLNTDHNKNLFALDITNQISWKVAETTIRRREGQGNEDMYSLPSPDNSMATVREGFFVCAAHSNLYLGHSLSD